MWHSFLLGSLVPWGQSSSSYHLEQIIGSWLGRLVKQILSHQISQRLVYKVFVLYYCILKIYYSNQMFNYKISVLFGFLMTLKPICQFALQDKKSKLYQIDTKIDFIHNNIYVIIFPQVCVLHCIFVCIFKCMFRIGAVSGTYKDLYLQSL